MIVSFLLQAADTVLKVTVFSSSLHFPQLLNKFFLWLTLAFSDFAGANLFGCKQKTEGMHSVDFQIVFIHRFMQIMAFKKYGLGGSHGRIVILGIVDSCGQMQPQLR
jgi:hypothetical protein